MPVTEYVLGQANYQIVDGAGRNRWGDYTGLAIDPSDDATFWAFNEYAGPNNVWATQFASFQLQEPTDEDWLQFGVQAGDILRIETFTPAGGAFEAVNDLDPDVEIFDPLGAVVPYANHVGNELLFHVAEQTGQYRLRVYAEDSEGEYFVQIEGATGDSLAPTVINTIPDNGVPLAEFPLNYTLTFSEGLQIGSVAADDLTIGGLPALSVTPLDGRTFEFAIDPASNVGDQVYQVDLAAGAVVDLQGEINAPFSATFELDTTPPVILETLWNGLPIRSSRQYDDGLLTFQALLSEDLFLAGSSRRGPFTPGADDVLLLNHLTGETVAPTSVAYSQATDILEVQFDALVEGDYTLTLLSGDGSLEDLVGNDLDGEPSGSGLDGTPTGDGAPGGDYSVSFTIDATAPQLNPFVPIEPFAGLAFASEGTPGFINSTGDQDVFEFFLEAGQTITAVATPLHPTATLSLELLGLTERAVSVAPGLPVALPLTNISGNALAQLRVSGSLQAEYELDVYRNAAVEIVGGDTDVGNPLAFNDTLLRLGSGRYAVLGRSNASPAASNLIVNGGFETGDFSGWIPETVGTPLNEWAVGSAGDFGSGFFTPISPQEGLFAAWNGFDGAGPMEQTLTQDLTLPFTSEPLILSWKDRAEYIVSGSLPRTIDVELRNPATDGLLATLSSFSTGVGVNNDTGWVTHSADVSAFAGQPVRLVFREHIPENFTGPGQFQLDDVTLPNPSSGQLEVDEYVLDLSGSIGQTIDVALAGRRGADFSASTLELLDDAGNVLAVGSADPLGAGTDGGNFDLAILEFVVPSAGAHALTFRLSTSVPGEYGLVVTESIVLDTEPNDDNLAPLRSLDQISTALGFLDRSVGGVLYGSSRAGELFTIDASTGSGALVGFLADASTEIEYDPLTGRAFSQFPDGAFAAQEFDIDTGAAVGPVIGNGFAFNGMEWIGTDLYATAISAPQGPSELRILDPATGNSTLIGLTGRGPISGLAFDPSTDLLLGIAGGPGPADLLRIDRTTGAATVIGSTGIQAGSLEFDFDGALYAGGTGPDQGNLYRIDPATGASTLIGSTGFGPVTGLLLRETPSLAGGNLDTYDVTLAAGQSFSATTETLFDHPLTHPTNLLDPSLRIIDPAGNEIASDDDAVDGKNATVSIQASVAGTYLVQIVSQTEEGGQYLLTTVKGAAPGDADGNGAVSGWDFLALQRAGSETDTWQAGYGGGNSAPTTAYSTLPAPEPSFVTQARSRSEAELAEVDGAYAEFDARLEPALELALGQGSEDDAPTTTSRRRLRSAAAQATAIDGALAAVGRWNRLRAL